MRFNFKGMLNRIKANKMVFIAGMAAAVLLAAVPGVDVQIGKIIQWVRGKVQDIIPGGGGAR